ncbi:tetratricopeptide repeat-containing sensor histidine kinase [Polaribacter sp. Hel1_85]|uniref:tetratricopeptide repeat-containing sensor histidine kinase n=1 Tax=Polaribacter sp. Hel1_85 TaxID=1250005 RepID=UPI00052C27E0|nr:tetratricopeptide repeat-containing sensor histidine kinase [Polaribacter sp. Hel1_85]KGL62394.1 two-component system-sensor histidine kinase [Polaribacter sp. Hel1_85]
MYKKIIFITLFINFSIFSQNKDFEKKPDSINVLLKKYKETNNSILPKRAFFLAEKTQIDSLIRKTYIDFGLKSYYNKDLNNLSLSNQKLLNLYSKNKDSIALAKHYHYKALFYRIQYKTDSLFYYYHKSKNISILLKDSLSVARRLLSMARIQERERDYLGSEISTIEGLLYIEPLNEKVYTLYLYNNLGLVLSELGRQKEARKNYLKCFEINKSNLNKKVKEISNLDYYTNAGLSYFRENNHREAIAFYKKGLAFDSLEYKYPIRYQSLLENLASSNYKLGKHKEALKGYKTALSSREKHNYLYEQSISHTILAGYYFKERETQKAIFHSKKGIKLAKQTNNSNRTLINLNLLSQLIKGEKGRQYLQEYIQLNDSLYKRERTLKNQFAKIRYETEKKDKENAGLKEENTQKQLLLESEKQQKTIGWLIAGTSILFIGFGANVVSSRRKKILFEAKLQQIEAREKERQQIAKSLHDEVAGDIRMLHLKLAKTNQTEEAKSLDVIKENVRNLSHQLSSESFDKVSFKDQIINLISDFFEIDFRIKAEKIDTVDWQNINNAIKRTLFLTIRESIQNAKKHAAAKNIILSFSETKNAVFLTISDNGKGFNVADKKTGIGLKNMKERIEEINGVFSIKSELEKGTNIDIEIPKHGK